MTETQPTKVYELAKELGIDSISLLDKLKDLNIKVKSHMSDLSPEEVVLAKSGLRPKKDESKTLAKKAGGAVRTRKTAAPSATPEKPKAAGATLATPSANPEKEAAPVKTTRTRTTKKTDESTIPAGASTSPATSRPSSVIRRRNKEDGSATIETLGTKAEIPSHEYAPESPVSEEPFEAQTETYVETSASVSTESPTHETETAELSSSSSTTNVIPQEEQPVPASTPAIPAPPKRSILKIVDPNSQPARPAFKAISMPPPAQKTTATPGRPPIKGTTSQDKDGFRIIKMTKENLDQMVEEEAAKKRGPRENDIRPEDVKFADYRKKEMVFLPKKKKIPVGKQLKSTEITEAKAQKRIVEVHGTITVQELANALSVKASELIKKLMMMGQMVTINQPLDMDTATLIASEYKYETRDVAFKEEELLASSEDAAQDSAESLLHRPPVVTIMGHVDHGKTTLLDSIREANVAAGEAGGITQHIGAYTIEKNDKLITFIDTPGHEAFTSMRARGANVTDIVILVVSADDGVMPQTREAISHAQAAKVPIIVAVNKIDKPGANPEKIKQALAELNLLAEDWGGDTMFIPVSALKRTNIDKLLDAILLQAEVLDLKANPNAPASGVILEARLERGRGPVASVLVKRGTLNVGDPVVAGNFSGKVKALTDDRGRGVKGAGPGFAVELLGLEGVPSAGEKFNATSTEDDARRIVANRLDQQRAAKAASAGRVSLDDLFAKIQAGDVKELNVLLKADVFGSVEAVRESLVKLSTEKVKVKVILAGIGGVTESDVLLASASNAIILGFNVRPETKARQLAESEHVEIKSYSIIYELFEDVKKAMTGLLDKKKVEKFLGRAEVRQVFTVPKIGAVAGSSVIDGKILRGSNVRLLRESRIIYEGTMCSLRRFKDDVKEVASGYECGIGIENYNDIKVGDIIEAYQIDLVEAQL